MSTCDKWSVCHSTLGSFHCTCELEFEMDAVKNFIDMNESHASEKITVMAMHPVPTLLESTLALVIVITSGMGSFLKI